MIGVFCSLDLVIFYLFFEAGLIPMFLTIGIWGGSRRVILHLNFSFYFAGICINVGCNNINILITGTTDVTKIYQLKFQPNTNIYLVGFLVHLL